MGLIRVLWKEAFIPQLLRPHHVQIPTIIYQSCLIHEHDLSIVEKQKLCSWLPIIVVQCISYRNYYNTNPTWDILPLILYMIINIPLVPLMVNVRELSWLSVLNKWSCDTLFPATISLWGRMEKYKKFSTWMCIVIRKMTGPVIVIFRTDFWNDNGTPLLLCHCYGMEKWGILYQISVQLWKPVVVNSLPNCVLSFPCKLAIKMMEYNLYVMS